MVIESNDHAADHLDQEEYLIYDSKGQIGSVFKWPHEKDAHDESTVDNHEEYYLEKWVIAEDKYQQDLKKVAHHVNKQEISLIHVLLFHVFVQRFESLQILFHVISA